jgi:formiminotetrahydrofolate cyclodeaminase
MAASLVVMVTRASPAWDDAEATCEAAEKLRDRLLQLGAQDVGAFAAVLAAQRGGGDLREALVTASRVPLEIAERAADVTDLATAARRYGKQVLAPDAEAAAILAEAATRTASRLVGVNLGHPAVGETDDDARLLLAAATAVEERSRAAAQVASAA